jgi:glutamate formiminotransferase
MVVRHLDKATRFGHDRSAMSPRFESVVNVSEGRRTDVVTRLARRVSAHSGVTLLDYSSDRAHNRSVFTMAGASDPLHDAIFDFTRDAVGAIDLRVHRGVHPRLGAVDVVPFIPLAGASMADAVALARRVGRSIGDRLDVPVYLYDEAASASAPHRRHLEQIRRGGLEGIAQRIGDPEWAPDFGPHAPHPGAGVTVVGARFFLIAYNVNLKTADLAVAREIAAAVRERGGGLPSVKALGLALADRGIVQVSMNLVDYRVTGIRAAFDRVVLEAARRGAVVSDSELIGLAPAAALDAAVAAHVGLTNYSDAMLLEHRLAQPH